ncbi:hypothetical protein MAPG_10474 [Magnaporthiopsis poae ATCC 64411]|uniref:PD-(D/E)XK nuclease-like domain-containing protein n=1 Tax=Magnaporthiopsis poae (strain ATCC 64411 / 73-15) TaxID=644358 RepID=A0A0C4ECP2_MAGP6|nr:hypothetical protein MAPG_10474 [Magnaporthiopsis poae ATCC 64411]
MQSPYGSGDPSGPEHDAGDYWFVERWLRGVTFSDPDRNAAAKRRHEMATPPLSHGQSQSPTKRRRQDDWTSEYGPSIGDPEKATAATSVFSDAPSLSETAPTFRMRPELKPTPSRSAASLPVSERSAARSGTPGGTAQRPGSRSTSPTKTTVGLHQLAKPVRFVTMAENAVDQVPPDVRGLYRHVRNIVVYRKAFMPLSIRDDIESVDGHRLFKTMFYRDAAMSEVKDARPSDGCAAVRDAANDGHGDNHDRDRGNNDSNDNDNDDDDNDEVKASGPSYSERRQWRQPSPRTAALAELDTLMDLIAAANSCAILRRHEATWNMEVHSPLFRLALDRPDCAHVLVEPVTHASIASEFLPPRRQRPGAAATAEVRSEAVDSKRVDFVLALFVDHGLLPEQQHGWSGRQREKDPTLAEAIHKVVADIEPAPGKGYLVSLGLGLALHL